VPRAVPTARKTITEIVLKGKPTTKVDQVKEITRAVATARKIITTRVVKAKGTIWMASPRGRAKGIIQAVAIPAVIQGQAVIRGRVIPIPGPVTHATQDMVVLAGMRAVRR
jgi:hypothetical protein